ncbi:MAG: aspartoacylase [Oculatellaceae cyanobacterium Prado106]|nr:aspartoacylase [Oculatellaceae cyanobacterium Prado106]
MQQVVIVGGTHGNEFTGAYLIKKFDRHPHLIQRSHLQVSTLLANPKAFAANRRYIERDLNRCFLTEDLQNPTLTSYEDQQAKWINQTLGPKGNPQVDFILDLHSTTTNMGLTLLLPSLHPFNLRLAAYLSTLHPLVKVCSLNTDRESSVLRSLTPLGCVIEVGPIAQGTLDATLFQQTETLIHATLDYLNAHNQSTPLPSPTELTLYQYLEPLDYPRNDQGELLAMIHPQLQFQDYQPLNPGDPMFLTFEGDAIAYSGSHTVYPIFINEAAYYEKGVALCLTERVTMTI